MNIKDINLMRLKRKLLEGSFQKEDLALVNHILFDLRNDKLPDRCDVVLTLGGSPCLTERLPYAVKLFFFYALEPVLILSGGGLLNIGGEKTSEAEAMRRLSIQMGIPQNKIYLESKSRNTIENIIYTAEIIRGMRCEETVIKTETLVVVSSATHLRRVKMNCDRYRSNFPSNMEIVLIPSSVIREDWYQDKTMLNEAAQELGFIHEYIYQYKYKSFEVG